MLNVNEPETRGIALALQTMLDDLGKGLVRADFGLTALLLCVGTGHCLLRSDPLPLARWGVMRSLPTLPPCKPSPGVAAPPRFPPAPLAPHTAPTFCPAQGPVFVAFFIERLGRTGAFNLSTLGWVPCGLLLLGTGALRGSGCLPALGPPCMDCGALLVCHMHCHLRRSKAAQGAARLLPPADLPTPAFLLSIHPAAFTLARDEAAMQHRLHKVLSSYTFSSTAIDQLAEQEQQEDQLNGKGPASSSDQAWQQERQRVGSSVGRHSSSGSLGVERAPP